MLAKDFEKLVSHEHQASLKVLVTKAKEYATKGDRLNNFKEAAGLRGIPTTEALMGMLAKHFVSVSDMAKDPDIFTLEQWDEKLRDIRNYTYLLKGLLIDMRSNNE